jgi:ribonuclease T1
MRFLWKWLALALLATTGCLDRPTVSPPAATVEAERVPAQAKAVAAYIRAHGTAPPGVRGGTRFANDGRGRGEVLPRVGRDGAAISYQEFDVHPYQPGVNRGAERLVHGSDGKIFYTDDHYDSFKEVR